MRKLLPLFFILAACAKNGELKALPIPDPAWVACATAPLFTASNFSPLGQESALTDDDLFSFASTGAVNAGDSRFFDIDYGCTFSFRVFQFSNWATNVWAFGTIQIFTADTPAGPWTLRETIQSGDAVEEAPAHFYRYLGSPIRGRFVRYSFKNETVGPIEFFISDLEVSADYVSGN